MNLRNFEDLATGAMTDPMRRANVGRLSTKLSNIRSSNSANTRI